MKNLFRKNLELLKLIFSALFILFSFIFNLKFIFILCAYLIISFNLIIDVFNNIKKGEIFDEKFLMLIATIGALIIGNTYEAFIVMLLYQIGELINDKAVDKSKDEIINLMNIKSDIARIIMENKEIEIDPKKVKINDIILVRPGEKIPIDGIILEGSSLIDTSSITGESKPIVVKEFDKVISGTINMNGALTIRVTSDYKNSTVNKILQLIEKSDFKKAKPEKFITKFAKIYTPVVCLLALIIFLIPSIITKDFYTWGYRSLVFLVTSCPCALVISVPLAYFSGIGACSRNGILVKNSAVLDNLLNIDEVIFDKTGTITEGVFEVVKVKGYGIKAKELLQLAALCECHNIHPIANSIKNRYGKEIDTTRIKNYKIVDGGITATIDGDKYVVGNYNLLKKFKINFERVNDIGTVVYISRNNNYLGYILINDKIRKNSKKTILELKKRGIKDLVVLSGDNDNVVKNVCKKVGITRYSSELLPQDKVIYIKEARKENINVMFIGDGVNDAPSILNSDIGVAMGGIGSDATIDASDIVIMNDDLSKINIALDIAHLTKKVVLQNIILVLSVKCLVLISSALGFSNMLFAIFADVGISLISIINTLSILKTKREK